MKLRVTIAATAVAVTLQTIIQLQYFLPLYEWYGSKYYAVLGLVQLLVGTFVGICLPMMGWAIYKNREQLPKLRPFMRIEALVICCLIGMLLVWYTIRYCVGASELSSLPIGNWLKIASYVLLSVWLWQMACTKNDLFASEEIGKAGKRGGWACVILIIILLASIMLIVAINSGEVQVETYSIIGTAAAVIPWLMIVYWLANYCYYNNRY